MSRWLPSPEPEPEPTGEDPNFYFKGWNTSNITLTASNVEKRGIDLKYDGAKRPVTLSGQKPQQVTYSINSLNDVIQIATSGTIPTGDASATVTLTLQATETYRSATCTITITNCAQSEIEEI